ncbi:hypothetical protein OGAPHI_007110 [Ogataea philodendri]|uniref:Ribosomal lysine N-methyltransferase 5 n=1 Tax=Ogataea philodendri TaxID=1378263 RepID=A0A9P8NWU3_9ASCO|nr:uncharacterized protein OGAPHI_007110 [Ogataea philodendri]KAH3660524.1 hypothetical protein OGAPHI_007110 [Ogataea philodendri]
MIVDTSLFEVIDRDSFEEHVFEMYMDNVAPESLSLGYIARKDELRLNIGDEEYLIKQSISALNSNNKDGTTGFVTWSASKVVVEWLFQRGNRVFSAIKGSTVLELGSGVSGLVACTIGRQCRQYVCTDQQGVMKLLKSNIITNGDGFYSSTIETDYHPRSEKAPRLDAVVYDWEQQDTRAIQEVMDKHPDFIITCDTIYNPYLIPYLVRSIETLAGPETGVLVGLQLRETGLLSEFLDAGLDRFRIYYVPKVQDGYAVYYMEKI